MDWATVGIALGGNLAAIGLVYWQISRNHLRHLEERLDEIAQRLSHIEGHLGIQR